MSKNVTSELKIIRKNSIIIYIIIIRRLKSKKIRKRQLPFAADSPYRVAQSHCIQGLVWRSYWMGGGETSLLFSRTSDRPKTVSKRAFWHQAPIIRSLRGETDPSNVSDNFFHLLFFSRTFDMPKTHSK